MTRLRTAAAVGGVVLVSVTLAWALTRPHAAVADLVVRAVSDGAAVVALGLALLPWLDVPRHRDEFAAQASRPLIAAAAVWVVAELVRLPWSASEAAGVPVTHVGPNTLVEFAGHTAAGRAGVVCLAAAVVVGGAAAVRWSAAAGAVAAGAAAVGLTGRTLVGHLAEDPWGGVAIAVHVLAASVWCGVLAALVLVVRHRGRWARVLPRFSQLSLACVAALVVAGAVGAVTALSSVDALFTTGYGRLLSAKVVLTVALVVLGWRNRTVWLPAARAHRATADVSALRSRLELAGMGVALVLAAALAVTG